MPDPSPPSAMTPFQLLFGHSLRTALDVLVPQMNDTETTGVLTNFIENRRHNMRNVAEALEKIHESRVKTRQRRNAEIRRLSSAVGSIHGDLVLARGSGSSLFSQGIGPKLVHEKWTGPWKVGRMVFKELSSVIEMEGRRHGRGRFPWRLLSHSTDARQTCNIR